MDMINDEEKYTDIRKPWFRAVKACMRLAIKKSDFYYIGGKKIDEPTIILSNHVGTSAPLAWELYGKLPFRFWGANEMNCTLAELYKYQTQVFYHEKKHWNIHLARLFCLLASPLTYMFYKGLNLISTYRDIRFKRTISDSIKTIEDGKSIIIFPEISDKGYLDVLEGFHLGFTVLCSILMKEGKDIPITVAYYKKKDRLYIVDKPVMLSELFTSEATRQEVADKLCARCNELGKMSLDENGNLIADSAEKQKEEATV